MSSSLRFIVPDEGYAYLEKDNLRGHFNNETNGSVEIALDANNEIKINYPNLGRTVSYNLLKIDHLEFNSLKMGKGAGKISISLVEKNKRTEILWVKDIPKLKVWIKDVLSSLESATGKTSIENDHGYDT